MVVRLDARPAKKLPTQHRLPNPRRHALGRRRRQPRGRITIPRIPQPDHYATIHPRLRRAGLLAAGFGGYCER